MSIRNVQSHFTTFHSEEVSEEELGKWASVKAGRLQKKRGSVGTLFEAAYAAAKRERDAEGLVEGVGEVNEGETKGEGADAVDPQQEARVVSSTIYMLSILSSTFSPKLSIAFFFPINALHSH